MITTIVFDLEFCGELPDQCFIWEIAGVVLWPPERRGQVYQSCVQMPFPVKQYPGYQVVSKEFLRAQGARPLSHVLKEFFRWCGPSVLISHGCFRSDKIVLEHAARKCHLRPRVWFVDTLYLFRDIFPGRPSYSLSSFTGLSQHRALPDAIQLARLLHSVRLPLPCPFGETPLRTVHGIGKRKEAIYNRMGLSSMESLRRSVQAH
jgi:DNA polymerase III epsilon subunit-like protein